MSWREFLKKDITPKSLRRKEPRRRKILDREISIPLFRWPRGHRLPGALIHPIAWYTQSWHSDIRTILTQVEAIVQTNSPLPDGLSACSLDAPNRRIARVFRKLRACLESGNTLGEAMEQVANVFPGPWIDLVHAGEQTGRLDLALSTLVQETNQQLVRGCIFQNRVAYFAFLFLTQLAIVSFITIKVLPVFAEITEEFGQMPQRSAATLLQIIEFLGLYSQALLWSFLALLFTSILGPFFQRRVGWVQSLVTYCLLPLPGLGKLHRNKNLERIAGVLQMLIAGGVPLPEALGAAAKIHISRPFQRVMASAQRAVEGGHPLSEELARHRYLMGETLVTMVKLGEHSGGLDESCGHAREFYRRAITRTQSTLADLLVPSGVFVCGSITLLTWLAAFGSFIAIGDAIITDM